MDNLSLLIFALFGWALSIYFGFFRYRQYQWTRRKVEGDLFARLNQNGRGLYWKLRALGPIRERNAKLRHRHAAVLEKYLDHWAEKRLLLRNGHVSEAMGKFWLEVWLDELKQFQLSGNALAEQLLQTALVSFKQIPDLQPLLEAATQPHINEQKLDKLYQHFIG
ncbi:MAG: hypothetical protein AAFY36_07270 [Bacteroidota bacterium]